MDTKEIESEVKKILLHYWDPININTNPNLQDEYDNYINIIIDSLKKEKTVQEIASLLHKIEQEDIGICGDFERCHRAASILKQSNV